MRIELKAKPCKGAGKAIGFKGCGTMQIERRYGLGYKCGCFTKWLFETEEGAATLKKSTTTGKQRAEKKEKKRKREEKEAMKSIARLICEARKPFQKFIRLRDINDACISCGTTDAKIWHAGHYFKAELYTGLIFDPVNCNKQCEKCNTFLDGNESGYRQGLIRKYGIDKVLELDEKANALRKHKFSREEIRETKTKYNQKIREFK